MSDYNFLMESRLSAEQFKVLTYISRLAALEGLNLYLVGGAVRDLTYGQQVIRDLDFVVEGNPQKILRRLERAGSRAELGNAAPVEVGHIRLRTRWNAADVRFANGVEVELAMSRSEIYAKPGRPPEINPAMIFDDLKRRDFSVNAMAVSLHPNSRGLLLDPTNGAADIESHQLRILHSRSIPEDPLRIFRLLRLGMRLGFKRDERTENSLQAALDNHLWDDLDPEGAGRELRAILHEENPGKVFKMLSERGVLGGLDQKLGSTRIPYDRFGQIRAKIQNVPGADPFLLNFCCLVEKLGEAQKVRLAKKIVDDPGAIKMALGMGRDAKKLAKVLGGSKAAAPSQAFNLLRAQPFPLLLYLLAYFPQAKVQNRIKQYLFKSLPLRGRLPRTELQTLGVKPGPAFEKILERFFADQLDGKVKPYQQVMKHLRALAGIKEEPEKPPVPAPVKRPAKKPPEPARPEKPAPKAVPSPVAEKTSRKTHAMLRPIKKTQKRKRR